MAPTKKAHPPKKQKGRPPANKGVRYVSEPLTVAEVHALLKACRRKSATGIRAAAMIVLGWRAGLRVGEVLLLRPADIDHERGVVHVLHAKGGSRKRRTVGLAPDALPYIDRWLDKREALGVPASAPLFCSVKRTALGHPMATQRVRRLMPKLAQRAGI